MLSFFTILYYIAIALFVGSAIGFGVIYSKVYKNQRGKELKDIISKNMPLLQVFSIIFGISLVFFTTAYYNEPATLTFFSNNGIEPAMRRVVLSHIFAFGLGYTIAQGANVFFFRYFVNAVSDEYKKFLNIAMVTLFIFSGILLLIVGELNGPYLEYPLPNSIYIGLHGIRFINSYAKPEPFYNAGNLDGGFVIAFYAVFILSGALMVFALCDHHIYQHYKYHGLVTTTFFIAFPMGLVGARLWYCILDISANGASSQFVTNPVSILFVWQGGLGIMGGAILGIISGVIQVLVVKYGLKDKRYQNISYLRMVDLIVPTILLAQAVGRFGNFFNGEVHGNEIDISLLNWLPYFIRNNYRFDGASIISDPTKAYLPLATIETITNTIGYFVLYWGLYKGLHQKHKLGACAGGYLIWYGATRAILEPLRFGEYKYDFSYMFSFVMMGAGLLIMIFFAVWQVLREKHLWMYKNRTVVDGNILVSEASNKVIIRNTILTILATLITFGGILILNRVLLG